MTKTLGQCGIPADQWNSLRRAQELIGFWAIGYAGRSIDLLVIWVGATALARGISSIFLGVSLHGMGKEMRRRMA